MYCQISLIKPKARQKEAMASLFGNHKQITLKNSDTPVILQNVRFNRKHCCRMFECGSESRKDLQDFCRLLNRKLKDTSVQLAMLTEGRRNKNYIIIDYSNGKSKTAARGCCSNDWTVKNIVQLHILEKTVSGFYS